MGAWEVLWHIGHRIGLWGRERGRRVERKVDLLGGNMLGCDGICSEG